MGKRDNKEVDENLLQEIISRGVPQSMGHVPPVVSINSKSEEIDRQEQPKQEVRKKHSKNKSESYKEEFFVKLEFSARQLIYVTKETHKTLVDIVQVAGGEKANLSSYVENIIRSHFESHKEVINGLYTNNFKPPIQ